MKKIVILGTNGNCIDIVELIAEINLAPVPEFDCVGFLDDNEALWGNQLHGLTVIGGLDRAAEMPDCWFVNGIGSPANFWKKPDIVATARVTDDRFATLVHPTASVSKSACLGPGTVIFQNATITSNVAIGKHVVVLPNTVVSHDAVVGDFVCIAGGVSISGNVTIGPSSYIGAGSSIIGGARVGALCLVGMGSVVLQDVNENSVVVGNPAARIRTVL